MIKSENSQLIMKALSILLLACVAGLAQTPPPPAAPPLPNLPEDTVICVFEDGHAMTVGEFKKIFAILPPETQQTALTKREDFLKGWAVMRKLAQMAKTDKLDEGSPAKEQLDYYSMRILTDAEMLDTSHKVSVPAADAKAYYDAHRDNYKEVQLKAIYLSFSDGTAPATSSASSTSKRTEEQTKVLAAKLVADLRGGADFTKLVEQYSDDATSKAKAGDFATIHGSDNIPEEVKSVVMALKQGSISEPLRQPSAIYIFRAETVSYKPFDEVSMDIFNQLKTEHFRLWLDSINRNIKVEFKSQEFLNAPAPAEVKPSGAHLQN